eukprot:1118079-Amphidinium_carterae.2
MFWGCGPMRGLLGFLDMRAKITRTKATMSQAAAAMMNALQQSSAIEAPYEQRATHSSHQLS